jgi:hypothetical protein
MLLSVGLRKVVCKVLAAAGIADATSGQDLQHSMHLPATPQAAEGWGQGSVKKK